MTVGKQRIANDPGIICARDICHTAITRAVQSINVRKNERPFNLAVFRLSGSYGVESMNRSNANVTRLE